MHNSMDVMYNPRTSYVALPVQGLSGQALSLHGYGYVEGTSNYNTRASAVQAANGQVNENEGTPISTGQQRTTTSSTDLSRVPDNELIELVWDHGQITMQGQSNSQISSNYKPLK